MWWVTMAASQSSQPMFTSTFNMQILCMRLLHHIFSFIRCSVLSLLSECTHFIWICVCVCVCVLQDKVGSLFTFDCVCAECGKTRRTRSDLKETHETIPVIRPQLSIMTQRHITKEKRTVMWFTRNRDVLFVPGGGAVALWLRTEQAI